MKKYLALVLALAMMLTMVAIPTMAEEDNRPTIRVTILDRAQVPADQGTYEDNWATRWINENSPVKVDFVACPRGSTYSNYNLWLAAGEAPDVIMEFQPEYVEEWANAGLLIDMKDYLDEYAPNYRKLTPEATQKWGIYNGGEYAITQERFANSVVNHMIYVRQDWLDNLGLSIPTSWEELENVIRAFSENDPDGNGQNDTWGWSMLNHYQTAILSMYGVNGNAWYKQEDGTFENANLMPERLEAVKFMEKIVDNGWCDKEWLSNPDDQYSQFATGKLGFLACEHANLQNRAWDTLKANFPDAKVSVMPSFTGYGYYQERECSFLSCVPTTCKNPEAVAQYIDWMITDGWEKLTYGDEGVDFKKEGDLYIDLLTPEQRTAKLQYTGEYAIVRPYGTDAERYMETAKALSDDNTRKEAYIIDAESVAMTENIKYRRDTPTANLGVALVVESMTDMNTYAGEQWSKALLDGNYTAEQAQEDIANEWANMDYDLVKEAFNEEAAKLGL